MTHDFGVPLIFEASMIFQSCEISPQPKGQYFVNHIWVKSSPCLSMVMNFCNFCILLIWIFAVSNFFIICLQTDGTFPVFFHPSSLTSPLLSFFHTSLLVPFCHFHIFLCKLCRFFLLRFGFWLMRFSLRIWPSATCKPFPSQTILKSNSKNYEQLD